MQLRLSSYIERFRASLFLVPMIGLVGALVLGLATITIDSRLDWDDAELPLGFSSTVESSRALLSTIAGATITFAGIAFSISLLTIQGATSQFSPRVVHTLFRDPFNKRVMALVVGTFTYCLIVLRSVRSPLESNGEPVIPHASVALAVVLGIATILATVAFIDHSAHAMDVSEILGRVTREATGRIHSEWTPATSPRERPSVITTMPGHTVRYEQSGWIQRIDTDAILGLVADGGTLQLDAQPGRYAIVGTRMGVLTPTPADPQAIERAICAEIVVGDTRTMDQDVSYGLRQLVDVTLRALSPGINDPTTAQDAIFHTAAVLLELLRHDPPTAEQIGDRGQRLVMTNSPTTDELVRLAFDETRRAASNQPTVCIYLLQAIALIREPLDAVGLSDRTEALVEQGYLIAAGCRASSMLSADVDLVEEAFAKRFATRAPIT
ncbi:MAG TPA: DUF2254 domain-containing protein [Acidimicrobiales bacterium]|nr:DUF2254 domain-containing protein [Acidimicrobiales bacterium]